MQKEGKTAGQAAIEKYPDLPFNGKGWDNADEYKSLHKSIMDGIQIRRYDFLNGAEWAASQLAGSPGWVKASERLPTKNGNYFCKIKYFYKDDEINNGAFNFTDGGFEIHEDNEIIQWLDESPSGDQAGEAARLKGLIEEAYLEGRNFRHDNNRQTWEQFKEHHNL